jgi:nitronate monooxygenase
MYPTIIQGGMGAAVSGWALAGAVSRLGQLGVVSGTALDSVLARRLQCGDLDGHLRRAIAAFPFLDVARQVLADYFIPGGKEPDKPFRNIPAPTADPSQKYLGLNVLASFVEVFLAKEGHSGVVGINLLEKIQLPTLPALFGAMLAGVDYVLMGAGIPRSIPGILDGLARKEPVSLKLDVAGAGPNEEFFTSFSPAEFCQGSVPDLKRPRFLPIVSSAILAMTLARKSNGAVDGFIVEGSIAGGHNAPPRGPMQLNARGEPIYGERDNPELEKIRALGLPFWLAGGFGTPEKLAAARSLGASGVQIGTPFAFCEESGIQEEIKREVIRRSREGTLDVFTDPVASPTGFPFKVLKMDDTLSDAATYEERTRVCDLFYLRQIYRKTDGTLGYRCPAEPLPSFLRKGGEEENTTGRVCVCNGLMSTIGLGQIRDCGQEPPLLTAGDDVRNLSRFLRDGQSSYSAAAVIEFLLS